MKRLVQAVAKGIKERKFRYNSGGEATANEQIEALKSDIKHLGASFVYDLNTRLDYGFVDMVNVNSYQ